MNRVLVGFVLTCCLTTGAAADSVDARCDIYPAGSDHASAMLSCTFSQRQGVVGITREDGVRYDLVPVDDEPGLYRDQDGHSIQREEDGRLGPIFRFPEESVFVYWDTAALDPPDDGNPTAPYSTSDYDATALLSCRRLDESENRTCPAGILRMDDGQASIVITGLSGEEFTINFLADAINATNRKVEAELEGDTWIVGIDGEEVYEVPLAAIESGQGFSPGRSNEQERVPADATPRGPYSRGRLSWLRHVQLSQLERIERSVLR